MADFIFSCSLVVANTKLNQIPATTKIVVKEIISLKKNEPFQPFYEALVRETGARLNYFKK